MSEQTDIYIYIQGNCAPQEPGVAGALISVKNKPHLIQFKSKYIMYSKLLNHTTSVSGFIIKNCNTRKWRL